MRIQLVCWACGRSKAAEVAQAPQFAFEVVGWANDIGMVGVFDLANRRALVFCSSAHAESQRTRSGRFRQRPLLLAQASLPA